MENTEQTGSNRLSDGAALPVYEDQFTEEQHDRRTLPNGDVQTCGL